MARSSRWWLAAVAMAFVATTACRREEAAPTQEDHGDPRNLHELVRGPMPPASAVSLARAATALHAALPQLASATAELAPAKPWQPGDEGTLLGLDDAEWYLAQVRAGLTKEFAVLAKVAPLQLRRELAGAAVQDTLFAGPQSLALSTRGLGWQVWRDSSGCAAILRPLEPVPTAPPLPADPTATTACPPHADQALALAGALMAVTRADLAPLLRVEALHSAGGTSLRLAIPAWRLRFRVRLDQTGQLLALDVPALGASMRLQKTDGQAYFAVYRQGDQLAWRWQPAALAEGQGSASPWQVAAEAPGVAMADGAALQALLEKFDASLAAARAVLLGPIVVEVHKTAGQWRAMTVRSTVLAGAAGLPMAAGTKAREPGPVVAVTQLKGQDPGPWLQNRQEDCLFLSLQRGGSLREGETVQLSARSCLPLRR
jgi:hypothetical protein